MKSSFKHTQKYLVILFLSVFFCNQDLAQCRSKGSAAFKKVYTSSLNPEIDRYLQRHLSIFENNFNIDAELFYYNDYSSPNAKAVYPPIENKRFEGSIVMGRMLIKELEYQYVTHGETLLGVLAHEFGHIVQYAWNSHFDDDKAELQADFIAGWLLGGLKDFYLFEVPFSFYDIGDFRDPHHHGTKSERQYSFSMGARYAGLSSEKAYRKSFEVVNEILTEVKDFIYINCPRCVNHEFRDDIPGYYNNRVCWLCGGLAIIPSNLYGRKRSRKKRSYIIYNGSVKDYEEFYERGCCVTVDY